MPTRIPDFRVAAPIQTFQQQLGPLQELPGTWRGHGFNLIARPDFEGGNDIFLELNPTDEELHFSVIGGPIPNRGSIEDDIEIFGIHYLQRISDHTNGGALHLEPGLWLKMPQNGNGATPAAAASPAQPGQQGESAKPPPPQIVNRLATIPHGTAVLMQGSSFNLNGPPVIKPANTIPFPIGGPIPAKNDFPEYDLSNLNQFRTTPTPPGVTQDLINDPNSLLAAEVERQTITQTTVLDIATAGGPAPNAFGGSEDIPFLGPNAAVAQVSAIFWIEKVEYRPPYQDRTFLQLQYTQTVILNFATLSWPHVTVATLRKVD